MATSQASAQSRSQNPSSWIYSSESSLDDAHVHLHDVVVFVGVLWFEGVKIASPATESRRA